MDDLARYGLQKSRLMEVLVKYFDFYATAANGLGRMLILSGATAAQIKRMRKLMLDGYWCDFASYPSSAYPPKIPKET